MAHILVKQIFRDWDEWLAAFKANVAMRREAGAQFAVAFRNPGQANEVLIYFQWDSLENANAFAKSAKLMDVLEALESGIPFMLTDAYETEG